MNLILSDESMVLNLHMVVGYVWYMIAFWCATMPLSIRDPVVPPGVQVPNGVLDHCQLALSAQITDVFKTLGLLCNVCNQILEIFGLQTSLGARKLQQHDKGFHLFVWTLSTWCQAVWNYV
jgi:hypothetical protein